jgi:hypothetical protein
MICGLWRGKAKGSLHARVLQSAKRQSKGARIFTHSQRRRGHTLLGVHIPRNHCRDYVELAEYQVPLYLSSLLYFMLEKHYISTFISNWFSLGGFYPGSCGPKIPMFISCMLEFRTTFILSLIDL